MVVLAAIGAGIAGIGALHGAKASRDQAREERGLYLANERLQNLENAMSISRTKEFQKISEGIANAQIGASGFAVGSSLDKYLDHIKETHASDIDWMRTVGISRAAVQEREASARAKALESEAKGRLISGLGKAAVGFGSAYSSFQTRGWGF